ncbi:MAG: metallophosphoesterase, partial [Terriglobia bacterium]
MFKDPILRTVLAALGSSAYILALLYTFSHLWRSSSSVQFTMQAALIRAPFLWWIFGSTCGFVVYLIVTACESGIRFLKRPAGAKPVRNSGTPAPMQPASVSRREFFHHAGMSLAAVPFAAGVYGEFYGRLDLKITHPRISLPRLPRSFDGFRILQLSDLHIGPFMTAQEIRRIVKISNDVKPEMVALTGDFITWDPSTQYDVVDALSALQAPYGVFGCLGNHEMWTGTEDSITRLFAACSIRILRQEQAAVREGIDSLNLIGVDFETHGNSRRYTEGHVKTYLHGVEHLVSQDAVNILLSHNPNTFDRAADMGIDLSLAGHTHGGQIALELAGINISPALFISPYASGWFRKRGGQLYVNRGIGTIAF